VVASNDVRFLKQTTLKRTRRAYASTKAACWPIPNARAITANQQYLKSPTEMAALFADIPEALENTVELAKRCNLELTFGTYYLPDFPVPGPRPCQLHPPACRAKA
jgi:DNA polymerase-3 subunit alpha